MMTPTQRIAATAGAVFTPQPPEAADPRLAQRLHQLLELLHLLAHLPELE